MSSSSAPNLDLPAKAPTESYSHESHNCDKLAIYTLVDLGHDGVNDLVQALKNGDDNLREAYKLPPKHDFCGKPLRDVYDYHLQLGGEKTHHPTLFIVAHTRDYGTSGVLLVNLNTDLKGGVDTCRLRSVEALLAGVNLAIGNMDWEDYKEDELALPSSGHSGEKTPQQTHQPTSQSSDRQSHSDFTFGAYGIAAGANMTAIRGLLEPDWREKDPKTWLCEAVCSYTDYAEPMSEVIKYHPWNCRRNPRLHRQWCICVDGTSPAEVGVLLVHINWDGDMERDPNELLKIGPEAQVRTERVAVDAALATLQARATEGQGGS